MSHPRDHGWCNCWDCMEWFYAKRRDSDGTATAAINEDLSVPQDCQARVRKDIAQ